MWEIIDNQLTRVFIFPDFKKAFSFMTEVALIAEKMDHHPDWSNCWNKVTIRLSTHEAGNIVTKKDYDLASSIDAIS